MATGKGLSFLRNYVILQNEGKLKWLAFPLLEFAGDKRHRGVFILVKLGWQIDAEGSLIYLVRGRRQKKGGGVVCSNTALAIVIAR